MEDLIDEFLRIEPLGSGSDSGSGSGADSGSGSGSGYGDGDGDGDGSGSGSGSGYSDGSGDGDGYGSGDGYGYGYGDGDGIVTLTDYRKGFITKKIASLKSFKGKPVYYIDGIPCTFLSIKNNIAKVDVIQDDYTTKRMYIAKSGNLFAHGETKEQAAQSVRDKFFASLSFEERKNEFVKLFKLNTAYPNKTWFDWHHHLTGSCDSGRMMFVKSHNIDLNGKMTTLEFINLTKNEYNGQIIQSILDKLSF